MRRKRTNYWRPSAGGLRDSIWLLVVLLCSLTMMLSCPGKALARHPVPCGCFGAAWAAAHSPAAIEHGLAAGRNHSNPVSNTVVSPSRRRRGLMLR